LDFIVPSTGSLLLDGERAAFRDWLASSIKRSGMTKTDIAQSLGADSTARINMYLDEDNPRIPTCKVTLKLAHALGEEPLAAMLVAGYYGEVIGLIDLITRGDYSQDLKDAFARVALSAFPRGDVLERLRFHGGTPTPIAEQLCAEPLITAVNCLGDESYLMAASRVHDPMLKRAVAVLADRMVYPLARRRIAAEYVYEWALLVAPHMLSKPLSGNALLLKSLQEHNWKGSAK